MADQTSRATDPVDANKTGAIRVVLTKELDVRGGIAALVENLPKWRDGALVLAGLAYVLGYFSWAFFAYDHGLGLAPVLDAQYFAAGVFPTAIVIASCFVAWCLRRLGKWIRGPVSPYGERLKTILEAVGSVMGLLGFVLFLVSKRVIAGSNALATASAVLIVVGVVGVIVSAFFSRDKADVWYHRFLMSVAWIYLPLVGTLAFLFYMRLFPALPQEFGGPRRQRVQLDVDVSKVSTNTLHLLAPEWQESHTYQSGIVRSRSLNLVFQNSEYLFLQIDRQTPPLASQVLKLKTSAVECLLPLDE